MKKIFCSLGRMLSDNKKTLLSFSVAVFCLLASAVLFPSCKAWRTITTTSTYQQANDSTKTTTTISTKTVEEYQGIRKK